MYNTIFNISFGLYYVVGRGAIVMGEDTKYIIPNLKKSCKIIEYIAENDRGYSISEIAKKLAIPRTSVMRILKTLESEDFVAQVNNEYTLSKKLVRIALLTLEKTSLRNIASPYLKELSLLTQQTAHIAVLSGDRSLLIDVCDSPNPLCVASRSGTLVELYYSSTGKVFLAYAIDDVDEFYKDKEFVKYTKNTAVNIQRVKKDIEETRKNGYGFDDEELRKNVRCLAAPIWGRNSDIVGAVGITAGADALSSKNREIIAKHVKYIAKKIGDEYSLKS